MRTDSFEIMWWQHANSNICLCNNDIETRISYTSSATGRYLLYRYINLVRVSACVHWLIYIYRGPILLTWFTFDSNMEYHTIESGKKLLIISQTSMAQPLKFGMDMKFNPTLHNGCNYLSMLGWKIEHVTQRDPRHQWSIPDPNLHMTPMRFWHHMSYYYVTKWIMTSAIRLKW